MFYAVLGLIVVVSIGLALYALIEKRALTDHVTALQAGIHDEEVRHSTDINTLKREMTSRVSVSKKEHLEQADRHLREIEALKQEMAARVSVSKKEHLEQADRHLREIEALKQEMAARVSVSKKEHLEQADRHLREIEALKQEMAARVSVSKKKHLEQADRHLREIDVFKAELADLEKFKHIPNVIEKSRALEVEIAIKLAEAQEQADEAVFLAHKDAERIKTRIANKLVEAELRAYEIIQDANRDAESLKHKIIAEMDSDVKKAKESLRIAEYQVNNLVEEAHKQAKQISSQARKEAKEKIQKVDEALIRATASALNIREKAESRAREIAGQAYDALKRYEFYEQAARAKQNVIEGYADTYMVPASHVIDELAEEFGFHKAGERLKIARDRTRVMEKNGLAATCNYPAGWKRDYAISFVLSAFNGKVDSILARLKPANQGKLIQEIRDVYALANHNGDVFKNARIHEEYLDARLEELKWAVAVQRVKEKDRDEQRAIREQIRDEEKARKEMERAIKQAEREEEAVAKAIEQTRLEYESANAEERLKLETKLQDLAQKLSEAEEKNRRAISMAQQTKRGNVYVISNVGSFGEDVYKIGLTRRLEPTDRVKELGGASVPFAFDIHAMIHSEDAPALEAALHRRFLQNQVNKVNRRKEFFRLKLQDIRSVVNELNPEVKWTMAADAQDYRDSLAMERQLQEDPEFRKRWAESEAAYEPRHMFDDDEGDQEEEDVVLERVTNFSP